MSVSKISDIQYRDPKTWKAASISPTISEIIDDVFRVTGEVYPGQWEMQATKNGSSIYPRPVIHFPEIIIRNRQKKSMKLKDLYVTFSLKPYAGSVMIPELEGIRTTFSVAQFTSGYMHSHLRSVGNLANQSGTLRYTTFCLGSGGINDVMNQLTLGWDKEVYRLFLLNIQTFIEYESLEGGPHCRMDSVFERSERGHRRVNPATVVTDVMRMQKELTPDDLTITYKKGVIRVVHTEALNNFLLNVTNDNDHVYVDEKGKSYPINGLPQHCPVDKPTGVTFMGKRVTTKMDTDETFPLNPKKSVHFLIRNLFIQYIEALLNKKLLDNYYGIKST